jgi:hypothetical protein
MELQPLDREEVTRRGWLRIPGYLDVAGCASLAKPQWLGWRPAAPQVGGVHQSGWFAPFSILARREPPELLDAWDTAPGDLVLLRGAGLVAPDDRCPLHEVGPPADTRTVLTFRHDSRDVVGWAQATPAR